MPKSFRKDVILDLDNTLFNSITIPEDGQTNDQWENYQKAGGKKCSNKLTCYNMDDYFLVYERPGLQRFLDHLFNKYNVSIWTASSESYASFILKNIVLSPNPKRKLKLFLYDEHCNKSRKEYNESPKFLEMLYKYNFDPRTTILIDDYDIVAEGQEDNVITIKPFNMSVGYEKDNALKKMPRHLDKKFKVLKKKHSSSSQKSVNN